ncbi:hypothetical protein OG407_02005 [Streptomyces sp. NBC_01515]|uniref:hypothetical protein n=1 Tax=Streptomyces sp. NBC_01515 TaxID=2903890 RepID=UPI00386AFE2B
MTATGHGRGWSGSRLVGTGPGERLRDRAHRATRDRHPLAVHLQDAETGVAAEVTYRSQDGVPVLHLESVSSLVVGCLDAQDPMTVDATDV